MNKNLIEIEKQLGNLVSSDKKRWVEIYELMHEVDEKKLYKDEYRSFTAWVNSMAARYKVHVSLLWERNKAGKFYHQLAAEMEKRGDEVKSLDELNATSENLVLIEKISQGNMEVASELVKKVDQNELKRGDLKNAWASIRAERNEKGIKSPSNSYEKKGSVKKTELVGIKAVEIINALSTHISKSDDEYFFGKTDKSNTNTNTRVNLNKKRLFTEFGVNTGSTHNVRRFDALIVENMTIQDKHDFRIHGVEIKVDKYDLLNDHKMNEYTDFCDTFWIAIPNDKDMIDAVESVRLDSWGVITIELDEIRIIHQAEMREGLMRNETIKAALLKLL